MVACKHDGFGHGAGSRDGGGEEFRGSRLVRLCGGFGLGLFELCRGERLSCWVIGDCRW